MVLQPTRFRVLDGAPPCTLRCLLGALAAILLSLEAVFAAAAGWLLLQEQLEAIQLAGCGLMLGGILISQLNPRKRRSFLSTQS